MAEPWQVEEPWVGGSVADWSHLPLLLRWQAEARRAEQEARREERAKEEARAERAEQREALLVRSGQEWAIALGQPWNPLNPYEHIPSAEARAQMYEAQEAAETRRRAKEALREAGLPVSLIRSALPEPAVDVPALPEPTADEIADAELARARRNTERARGASLTAKIRRVLGDKS